MKNRTWKHRISTAAFAVLCPMSLAVPLILGSALVSAQGQVPSPPYFTAEWVGDPSTACATTALDANFALTAPTGKKVTNYSANLVLIGSPNLDWTYESGYLLDSGNETFRASTLLAPETVSGICIKNLTPTATNTIYNIGTLDLNIYIFDQDGKFVPTPIPATVSLNIPEGSVENGNAFLKFTPALLVKDALFRVYSFKGTSAAYRIIGLNLSEPGNLLCSGNNTEPCLVNNAPIDQPKSKAKVVSAGEMSVSVGNLEQGSGFAADLTIEKIVTFVDDRDECDKPATKLGKTSFNTYTAPNSDCPNGNPVDGYTPRGLLLNLATGETQKLCNAPDAPTYNVYNVPQTASVDPVAWVPGDYCGIKGADNKRVIRVALVDSSYDELNQEDIESRYQFIIPKADGNLPECLVQKTDSRFLWFYRFDNYPTDHLATDDHREVPIFADSAMPPTRLKEMLDLGAGCNGLRSRLSINAWNLERSPSHDQNRVFNKLTQVVRATLRQIEQCTTNGYITSGISAYVDKYERYVQRKDWTRAAVEVGRYLDLVKDPASIEALRACRWDFGLSDTVNPVPGTPLNGPDSAGYASFLKAVGYAQQYQICSQFAEGNWPDPDLNYICECFLSENAKEPLADPHCATSAQ